MDINSIVNSSPGSYHSKQGSFFGVVDTVIPYQSGIVHLAGYAQFAISLSGVVGNLTLQVFGLDSQSTILPFLIYQNTIPPGTAFNRRFAATYQMVYYVITSDNDDTIIRLSTHLLTTAQFDSSKYINSTYSIENNAQLVLNANNFHMDLVRGMHNEFKKVNIEGECQAIPTINGGFTMGFDEFFIPSQTAEQLYIRSTSSDDTNAGTGATEIRIIYINDSGVQVEQVYPTIGITKASLFGVVARLVIRCEVNSTGGDGANQGTITIDNLAGTKDYAIIRPGTLENLSHGAIYMVPDNKQLVLREINLTGVTHGADVIVHSWIWRNTEYISYTLATFRVNTTNIMIRYDFDGLLSEKDVVSIDIYPDSGTSAKTSFSANLNAMLCPMPNNY